MGRQVQDQVLFKGQAGGWAGRRMATGRGEWGRQVDGQAVVDEQAVHGVHRTRLKNQAVVDGQAVVEVPGPDIQEANPRLELRGQLQRLADNQVTAEARACVVGPWDGQCPKGR